MGDVCFLFCAFLHRAYSEKHFEMLNCELRTPSEDCVRKHVDREKLILTQSGQEGIRHLSPIRRQAPGWWPCQGREVNQRMSLPHLYFLPPHYGQAHSGRELSLRWPRVCLLGIPEVKF